MALKSAYDNRLMTITNSLDLNSKSLEFNRQ